MRARCVVAAGLISALAIACREQTNASVAGSIDYRIVPSAPVVGPSRVEFTIHDALGAPVRGAAVRLEATMTHAGMAPQWLEAKEKDGRYLTSVEFTMAGDWVLLVEARLPDGTQVERIIDVPAVGAP